MHLQEAEDVPDSMLDSQELRDLVQTMIDTMRAAPGVGLAAPQIGVPLKVSKGIRSLMACGGCCRRQHRLLPAAACCCVRVSARPSSQASNHVGPAVSIAPPLSAADCAC